MGLVKSTEIVEAVDVLELVVLVELLPFPILTKITPAAATATTTMTARAKIVLLMPGLLTRMLGMRTRRCGYNKLDY
jgi:hypothetical protein